MIKNISSAYLKIRSSVREENDNVGISIHVKHIEDVQSNFPTHLDGVPIELVDTGGRISCNLTYVRLQFKDVNQPD